MAMRPSKETLMIGQALLIGSLYALVIVVFAVGGSFALYLSVRQVDWRLFLLGVAAGFAVLSLAILRKNLGNVSFFRPTKPKLKA